tara:strand:- start:38 stop:751 length:714 start_codon:yes stop_codon:yes gene_type:complete
MNFKKIVLGVIVIIILYLVYVYVFSDTTQQILYSGGNAKEEIIVKKGKFPTNKTSNDYTFSIWIYVNSWNYKYGKLKTIFRRSDENKTTLAPQVSLGESTNKLVIDCTSYPDSGQTKTPTPNNWEINNIPIQKWCNIIISTNNRAVDTYIDGKLVNTNVLKGVPMTNSNFPATLCPDGGFSGEISKFKYFARTISPREAYEIYREGPGGNWLSDLMNQYKLKVQFLKDNEEINGFEI